MRWMMSQMVVRLWIPCVLLFAGGCVCLNKPVNLPKESTIPLYESCSLVVKAPEGTESMAAFFRKAGTDVWREALPPVALPTRFRSHYKPGNPVTEMTDLANTWSTSFVWLKENTAYEVKVELRPSGEVLRGTFKTKNSDVKIAETIYLDDLKVGEGGRTLTKNGNPDGWIRCVTRDPEAVLTDAENFTSRILTVKDSSYLVLEGLTLRGGNDDCLVLENCSNIKIVNCDISGQGRVAYHDLEKTGYYISLTTARRPKGRHRGQVSGVGIKLINSTDVLIERNHIHAPASSANAWFHSHPQGPQAITVPNANGRGLVIRYNDLIASDTRRWNDVIGGGLDFERDGGYRDSAIYGNLCAFANDDGIELDGGQRNVACYYNVFMGGVSGVSADACVIGPSYVFRNLIIDLGDVYGSHSGYALKNAIDDRSPGILHYFSNTSSMHRGGTGSTMFLKDGNTTDLRDNLFFGGYTSGELFANMENNLYYCDHPNLKVTEKFNAYMKAMNTDTILAKPIFVDRLAGNYRLRKDSPGACGAGRIPNFQDFAGGDIGAFPKMDSPDLPYRPIPLRADRSRVNFSHPDDMEPKRVKLMAEKGFSGAFRIRKNDDCDWFSVVPENGVFKDGGAITLTVTVHPEKMPYAKRWRAVFLARLEDGYSRPVSVFADMRASEAVRAREKGIWLEVAADQCGNADRYKKDGAALSFDKSSSTQPLIWRFTVPEDGYYYFFGKFSTTGIVNALYACSVDGDEPREVKRHAASYEDRDYRRSSWRAMIRDKHGVVRTGGAGMLGYKVFRLSKGEHELTLYPLRPINLERLAVTNDLRKAFR